MKINFPPNPLSVNQLFHFLLNVSEIDIPRGKKITYLLNTLKIKLLSLKHVEIDYIKI